jgi:hypothetical protein
MNRTSELTPTEANVYRNSHLASLYSNGLTPTGSNVYRKRGTFFNYDPEGVAPYGGLKKYTSIYKL